MTVEEKEKATTYYVPTFVQMRVLFWVGEPAYGIGLHTILVLSYSLIGNST
jgi:hypothetical protein